MRAPRIERKLFAAQLDDRRGVIAAHRGLRMGELLAHLLRYGLVVNELCPLVPEAKRGHGQVLRWRFRGRTVSAELRLEQAALVIISRAVP